MRKHYIDNIRWITVVIVVIYHVIYMFNGIVTDGVIGPFYKNQYQDALQYVLYPWIMVILFLVAGMSSRYYLDSHTVKEFVSSRTRKLLVPSTLGLLVFGCIQGYYNMLVTGAFENIPDTVPKLIMYPIMCVSGTGVLWFIQMLWVFSMVLALIRKIEKNKLYGLTQKAGIITCLLLGVPVYFSGLVLNTPLITVYRFGIYGLVFFLGYFLFAHDEVIDRLGKFAVPLGVVSVILCGVYIWLHYGDNYAVMPVVGSIPAAAYCWTSCLAILGGMKRYADKTGKVARFFNKRSFGLYVFHYLPLSATAWYLTRYTDTPAILCYLAIGFAGFAGGWLLYEIVSRIPLLRYITLGIKKEKKNVL
ncbi:MAG: acyltransferase [Clostridia bacterium]|nr:acyltransferase [Clostridia bacterium]